MISVPNRPLQLSGSRYILNIFIFLLILSSCSSARVNERRTIVKDTVPKDSAGSGQFDRKISDIKVDTLKWTKIPEEKSRPVVIPQPDEHDVTDINRIKNPYRLKLLAAVPLNAKDYIGSGMEDEKYLQYYAGMQMALQQLEREGYFINIEVVDAVTTEITKEMLSGVDVVFAPNDKGETTKLIEWASDYGVKVVSPWYSSSRTAENAPHYIQLKPNLREHFDKMIYHAAINFPVEELVLVGRDIRSDKQWISYLQSSFKKNFPQYDTYIKELLIDEKGFSEAAPIFQPTINKGGKVFIFPHYSPADENFLFLALKRLSAEKADVEVFVYGLPLIIEAESIGFDIYNALNIKVVTSEYLDFNRFSVKRFTEDFFKKYGTFPEKDAFEAYDKTLFSCKYLPLMSIDGINVQVDDDFMMISFDIQPVKLNEDKEDVDFYENKHLYVLGFIDGNFTNLGR